MISGGRLFHCLIAFTNSCLKSNTTTIVPTLDKDLMIRKELSPSVHHMHTYIQYIVKLNALSLKVAWPSDHLCFYF